MRLSLYQNGSKYVSSQSIIQLLGLLSKMDLLLSRLGAKREGNTHPFYPLMLPPGTIAQNKPVGPVRGPDSPSTHRSVFESTAASCKTEINDDVAVLMEANTISSIPACVKTELDQQEIIEFGNNNQTATEPVIYRNPEPVIYRDPRKRPSSLSNLYTNSEPEKPKRKIAKPIEYKNFVENQNRSLKLLSIKPKVEPKVKKGKPPKSYHPLRGYIFHIEYNDMMTPSSKPKYHQYVTDFASEILKDYVHLRCINNKTKQSKTNPINCRARLQLFVNTEKLAIVAEPS